MSSFATFVPAEQTELRHINLLREPMTGHEAFRIMQRDAVHLTTITGLVYDGVTYHVAAFGYETEADGTDPHVSHRKYNKCALAAILRDDQDGPTIYGPMLLVMSTSKAFIEKTVRNVLSDNGALTQEAVTGGMFVITVTDRNGVREILANDGQPVRYSKSKAMKVAESMARDDERRGISHNTYAVAKARKPAQQAA